MTETKQPTKPSTTKRDANLIWDRMIQVLAGLSILGLAYYELLRHVKAAAGLNYAIAGFGLSCLLYALLAPKFRKY